MAAKLGLRAYSKDLTQRLFQLMARDKVDFTNLFRQLANVPSSTPTGTWTPCNLTGLLSAGLALCLALVVGSRPS